MGHLRAVSGFMRYKRIFFVFLIAGYVILMRKLSGNDKRKLTVFNEFRSQFEPSHSKNHRIDYSYSHPMETDTACHLPYTIPDNYEIRYFIESRQYFKCPSSDFKTMVQLSSNGTISLKLEKSLNYKCFYLPISGTLQPNQNQVKFKGSWTPLKDGMQLNFEQFVARCIDMTNNRTVFLDAFAHISDKKFEKNIESNPLNIVLLILDSVSKSQFQRHMPKSMQFFDKHEAAFMHSYTSNSYESEINMMSMLAAKVYDSKKYGFTFNFFKYWIDTKVEKLNDDLLKVMNPIFAQAQKKGYITMYNEDLIKKNGGLFHQNRLSGYSVPPANYYYRPFYQYLYSNFANNSSKICLNGKITGHRTLDLMDNFSTKYRNSPHFSFNFVGTAHHNPNDLQLLDNKLSSIMWKWKENGILDRTAFIIASNHGQLNHPIQTTFHGRIEERNPVLVIQMPKKHKEERPEDARILKINENRLSTHIDLYETMRELLHISSDTQIGRSFFSERPATLTCKQAQIPDHMCPCWVDDGIHLFNATKKDKFFIPMQMTIERLLEGAPCLKEFFMLETEVFSTYSMVSEVRAGERNLSAYRKRNDWHNRIDSTQYLPFLNEYVNFEAMMPMTAVWEDNTRTNFAVRSRMTYNNITNEMQHTLKPILIIDHCEEKNLENICNCS